MNISVKGEYALQAILDIAMHSRGGSMKIADIAKRQKIPQKFLELILAGLKQGGFVESRRGAEGGYLLARPPGSGTGGGGIRFGEGGGHEKGRSRRKAETPFSGLWEQVDRAISDVIDKTTFADLIRAWDER